MIIGSFSGIGLQCRESGRILMNVELLAMFSYCCWLDEERGNGCLLSWIGLYELSVLRTRVRRIGREG